jgi:glutamate--cysteine ligase
VFKERDVFRVNREYLGIIREHGLEEDLFKGRFGLEKENLRVTEKGELARTPHPAAFGDKGTNPYITTDFSESQIEMITPPFASPEGAYDFMDTIHNIVALNLDGEYLWPQSLPPILPPDDEIPIARFSPGDGERKDDPTEYRKKLAEKYGVKKQLISGIHYNFSFEEDFLRQLYDALPDQPDFRTFKDRLYMKVVRNMSRLSWLMIRLFGNSPAIDSSYIEACRRSAERDDQERCPLNQAASIRNGRCGYKNIVDFNVPLNSLEAYAEGIQELIDRGELISAKEFYAAIRPKAARPDLDALKTGGIEYLELRVLDINPLFKLGISLKDLKFIHLLFVSALILDEAEEPDLLLHANANIRTVADWGRRTDVRLTVNGESRDLKEATAELFHTLGEIAGSLGFEREKKLELIASYERMAMNPEKLYSSRLSALLDERDFISFHLDRARSSLAESRKRGFSMTGHEDMELSTQILMRDALRRGVRLEVLDRAENFIQLSKSGKTEYIKQATKTSLDSYSSVLVMENKQITKKILRDAGVNVPRGEVFTSRKQALSAFRKFKNRKIVIKPNNTNFGVGITIFIESFGREEYERAVDLAFDKDETVLVEEFAPGREYRVFVIGDEVVGVLHRLPANVKGDGEQTIARLIEEKNGNPMRGRGYKTPLEKIKRGVEEEMYLKQQGLSFESVPPKDQVVFLRENSNISTGGDSIDYTDRISEALKRVALKAARAVGAKIVGVDLMTTDLSDDTGENYTIIELNFNPAIHIHCFPLEGKNRKLGDKILDILGF